MKKTNFLKGLALAAVVLVGGFATSCSEEELQINGSEITLPAASASVSISVVDLETGKLVGGITNQDATSAIGSTLTVECPANAGYTTAAPITVSIPALQKGQSVNVPVTFYVVTLDSALEEWMDGKYYTTTLDTDAEPTTVELKTYNSYGWTNGVYTNDTDETLVAWENSPEFEYQRYYGWEFDSEIEASEESSSESEVVASSRAAETTVIDLLKAQKFYVYDSWTEFNISAQSIFTVKSVKQNFYKGTVTYYDDETGEKVIEFKANIASYVMFDTEEKGIGHDGHDGHNGHGHGGNSNAGGGIGGDTAGE